MGGCRCFFRKCNVSSDRNPGMHFFRFPLKNEERLKKWIRLSGVEEIFKNIPEKQQRNKVICGRHFPEESFMNYKQDRLNKLALPSLHRLNEEWALDYGKDSDQPELIKIVKSTLPHLKAPEGFPCPLRLSEKDRQICEETLKIYQPDQNSRKRINSPTESQSLKKPKIVMETIAQDEYYPCEDFTNECSDSFTELLEQADLMPLLPHEEKLSALKETSNTQSIVTNKERLTLQNTGIKSTIKQAKEKVCVGKSLDMLRIEEQLNQEKQEHSATKLKLEQCEKNCLQVKRDLQVKENKLWEYKYEILKFKTSSKVNVSEATRKLQNELDEKIDELQKLKNDYTNLMSEYNGLQEKYQDLQEICKNYENQKVKRETREGKEQKSQQQPLTKLQLFNGIKKYLSETMVALLRIQLSSGNLEREWKPDERRVSLDVFHLGEKVYEYFTSEWLIRLPPLHQIRLWSEENLNIDDEDDL